MNFSFLNTILTPFNDYYTYASKIMLKDGVIEKLCMQKVDCIKNGVFSEMIAPPFMGGIAIGTSFLLMNKKMPRGIFIAGTALLFCGIFATYLSKTPLELKIPLVTITALFTRLIIVSFQHAVDQESRKHRRIQLMGELRQ